MISHHGQAFMLQAGITLEGATAAVEEYEATTGVPATVAFGTEAEIFELARKVRLGHLEDERRRRRRQQQRDSRRRNR